MVHQVKDDVYEWSDPDRFFAGIKLLNANKGKKLFILVDYYLGRRRKKLKVNC